VLSVGGNDALGNASVLDTRVASTAQALGLLADIAEEFEGRYGSAIDACLRTRVPLSICTIYNGNFPDTEYQRIVSTALKVFNDAILRVAIEHSLTVIDLRLLFSDARDYANPIEPSSRGGEKIARVIAAVVTGSNAHAPSARVVIDRKT
jgi:hypothetical protein